MSSILRRAVLPMAVAVAMLGVLGAFGGNTRSAEAITGDICAAYVGHADGRLVPAVNFDGQGNDVYVVSPGTTYGLVFRVEDIISAWLLQLVLPNPNQPPPPSVTLTLAGVLPGPNVHVEIDSETGSARITSQAQAFEFSTRDNVLVGGPRGFLIDDLWLVPNVTHVLINPGVISQVTQTYNPRWFNNSSGFPLDSINSWLENPAGMYPFANESTSVCGAGPDCGVVPFFEQPFVADPIQPGILAATVEPCDDSWGYVDFECIESGYFHIDLRTSDIPWGVMNDLLLPLVQDVLDLIDGPLPLISANDILERIFYWNLDPARTGKSLKFYCTGYPDSATIAPPDGTVETQPTGVGPDGLGTKTITVTTLDQDGERIDGAEVTFTTDNCTFQSGAGISPAGGGATVTTWSDTDSTSDTNFIANNPLELAAGTAEVVLDCTTSAGAAGVANIKAVVQRPGSDIVLGTTINVVGPTAVGGLTLELNPTEVECGEPVLVTATAIDALGKTVSDGTEIYITTNTRSGEIGGLSGAHGGVYTIDGKASATIATSATNPGIHTVIAFTRNDAGTPNAHASATYTCDAAVAGAAPTVAPTGAGTGVITPPNTGDAGLAASSGSTGLFVIAGVAAFLLAGVASLRFARI